MFPPTTLPIPRLRHEMNRRVINALITDVVAESRRRIAALAPRDAAAIRHHSAPVIAFSDPLAEANRVIKEFLYARMYRHWRQARMHHKARRTTGEMFAILHANPALLPDDWGKRAGGGADAKHTAGVVVDYIAGMTDRYAMDEHLRLTDISVSG